MAELAVLSGQAAHGKRKAWGTAALARHPMTFRWLDGGSSLPAPPMGRKLRLDVHDARRCNNGQM